VHLAMQQPESGSVRGQNLEVARVNLVRSTAARL